MSRKILIALAAAGAAVLGGCASDPYYYDSYTYGDRYYYERPGYRYYGPTTYYAPRYYAPPPQVSLGIGYSSGWHRY